MLRPVKSLITEVFIQQLVQANNKNISLTKGLILQKAFPRHDFHELW